MSAVKEFAELVLPQFSKNDWIPNRSHSYRGDCLKKIPQWMLTTPPAAATATDQSIITSAAEQP